MAIKYVCDRCLFESNSSEITKTITIPAERIDGGDWETKYDLCSSCIRNLVEFLKPIPKQGK